MNGDFFRLGLCDNTNIVAVAVAATFAKPRFTKSAKNKIDEVELLRLCTVAGKSVVGGASKLITHFVRQHPDVEVITSFCDERVFDGNVYAALGFVKVNNGNPATWYFGKDGQLKHRMGFQKKRLLSLLGLENSQKTEWELAQDLHFNRVWIVAVQNGS